MVALCHYIALREIALNFTLHYTFEEEVQWVAIAFCHYIAFYVTLHFGRGGSVGGGTMSLHCIA